MLSFFASIQDAGAEELSFARALKIARERAPEMKAARAKLASSEAAIGSSRATYFPSLTANGVGEETAYGESAGVFPPQTVPVSIVNYTTAVGASGALRWTLYDFGRTSNAVHAARAARDSSVASVANAEAELIVTVAGAYLDVAYGEKTRDILRTIVDDRERSIQVVKGLVKQGLNPAAEELRAQSRSAAARRDLETAEAHLVEARVGLLAFLGFDSTAAPPVFSTPRLVRARPEPPVALRDAEERAPAVVAARSTAASGEASIDAARSRYYPSVTLSGDASYRVMRVDVFDSWLPLRTATGGLGLTVPIWDPTNGPQLDQAKADSARAAAVYEEARRDARTEAAKSLVALTTSERVLDFSRKAAESSAAVLTLIRARHAQGLSSALDLIDAETSDAEARIATVHAERAADGAVVRMLAATGRSSKLLEGP